MLDKEVAREVVVHPLKQFFGDAQLLSLNTLYYQLSCVLTTLRNDRKRRSPTQAVGQNNFSTTEIPVQWLKQFL